MLNVSTIQEATRKTTSKAAYQEIITAKLSDALQAKVKIKGVHQGVLVTTTAG
jgi:GTP cyclohydrolase I